MDPAALASLCLLFSRGQTARPLPAGITCPPAAPAPAPARPGAGSPTEPSRAALERRVATPQARDAITRVAFAEAGNQGDSGLAAVVYTILNRLEDGRWGDSVEAVVNARGQFEPVMRAGGDWRRLPAASEAQKARIETILNLALEGRLPDLTNGARFFQNPRIVADRAGRGEVSAGLVNFGGADPSAVIGAHSFYVEARRGGGGTKHAAQPTSPPRGPREDPDWKLAGGAIFVGDNRIPSVVDEVVDPVVIGSGEGAPAAEKLTDPGRAIFVVGPGLAAGSRR